MGASSSAGGAILGIGLDLGAVNVRVAYAGSSLLRTLTWEDGSDSTPSALGMAAGKLVHGREALEHLARERHDVVVEPLMLDGGALLCGVRHPVEELIGWWFSHIAARIEHEVGPERRRFAVCVPFKTRERHHAVVASAASRTGTELLYVVQSTTAAAVGYARASGVGEVSLLVLDAGARKVEAAVVRVQPERVSVLACAGESQGGGYVDESLANECIKHLVPGLDPRRLDPARRAEVVAECEQARMQLSQETSARVHVAFLGADAVWKVSRELLAQVAEPLRLATERTCEKVIAESRLSPERLGAVIVIGAMGRTPLVLDAVRRATGRTPEPGVAETLAAQGAAVLAASAGELVVSAAPSRGEPRESAPPRAMRTAEPPPPRSAPPMPPAARMPSFAAHLLSKISSNPPAAASPSVRPSVQRVLDEARSQRPPSIIDSRSRPAPAAEGPTQTAKMDAALRAFLDEGAESPRDARPARKDAPSVAPGQEVDRSVAPSTESRSAGDATPAAQCRYSTISQAPRAQVSDNERPSLAPPGARGSIPPGAMMPPEGTFIGVRNAADILELPLRRPIGPGDLDPIRLPSLLMAIGRRKDLVGVLELARGDEKLRWDLSQGGAVVDSNKARHRFLACFLWDVGAYRIEHKPVVKGTPEQLSKLVVDGLRWVLRHDDEDHLSSLLGEKLRLAPRTSARGRALASAVGLWPSEQRFLRYQCDGSLTGQEAIKSGGIARSTALQVIFLLDALGEVGWAAPERKAGPSLQQQVESRAAEAPHANYFDLLGLHWSVEEGEVSAAYAKMLEDYGPDSQAARVAPAACSKLVELARAAHDTLSRRASRIQYLLKINPDLDVLSLSELLKTRAEALAMKGDGAKAAASQRLVKDMDPYAKAAAARVIDLKRLKGP